MYAMSYTVANAVSNALSFKAWQPDKVLSMALRLVPDLDNVALHMIQRTLDRNEWDFGCPVNQRLCLPIARELCTAVEDEIERRRAECRRSEQECGISQKAANA